MGEINIIWISSVSISPNEFVYFQEKIFLKSDKYQILSLIE